MTELFEKSIRVLELPQLLERLSQKAVSEAAKERALRLTPSTDADDVRRLQDETDAARALIGLRGSPSFSGVKDVREALARAERGRPGRGHRPRPDVRLAPRQPLFRG